MSGSGASNIGYGNMFPFSNVNGNYVNTYSTNNPLHFGSNQTSSYAGLPGTKNNVDAAAGMMPKGVCLFKGGSKVIQNSAKTLKRKIKNISKQYKNMKYRSLKSRLRKHIASSKRRRIKHSRKRRTTKKMQKGGYAQFQNNQPLSPNYSVGGQLSASQLGLANPPPISINKGPGFCTDNYNHFLGKGFPSRGH